MRRLIVLVVLAGCASGPPESHPSPRAIFTGDHGVLTTSTVEQGTVDSVAAAPNAVMRALLSSYEEIGIKVTLIEPQAQRLGNPDFSASGSLGGERLSKLVKCGDSMTGSRADDSRIYLSVVSTVRARPGGSEIETRLEALARDERSGASADRLPCSTTGVLEGRIHRAVRQHVGS